MHQLPYIATVLVIAAASLVPLSAQVPSWGAKLFPVREYDFGKVKPGTTATYRFVMGNPPKGTFTIDNVRSSANYLKVKAVEVDLKPGKGHAIDVELDTSRLREGKKGIAIIVVMTLTDEDGRQFSDDVRLTVWAEAAGN